MPLLIPRSPWPISFPDVIIHGDVRTPNTHRAYAAAKAGDTGAAKHLAEDLLAATAIEQLDRLLNGRSATLLAVTADEVAGFNAMPDAMAQALALNLGLTVAAGSIVQANKVGHTKADG